MTTPLHHRGFTLVEMMVAMAMAGVLAASALGAGMAIHNVLVDTRRRVVVWDEAKRVEEALLSRVQEAGGDPMAAADSIIVEDNCAADPTRLLPACAGADRITIMSAPASTPSCRVDPVGTTLRDPQHPTTCCITAAFAGPAVLLADDGDVITLDLHSPNVASCQVTAPMGQGNPGPKTLKPGVLALLGPGNIETIFPRSKGANGEYELMVWKDAGTPGNGRVDPNELELFADRLYDFQIALGYDSNPEDGDVVDTNSATDEWIGNAEVVGATLPTGVARSQLRMIDLAIAIGVPSSRFNTPVQLLNRTAPIAPTNTYLAATRGQVGFRNLNLSVP
jgi:prepilin-type N-terminal cleavage/methylation domain-containing protein